MRRRWGLHESGGSFCVSTIMNDRLTVYGIILAALYIGLYIWNQKEEIVLLNEHIIKQEETLLKHRDLIDVQREYIELLEVGFNSPLYGPVYPLYKDPI